MCWNSFPGSGTSSLPKEVALARFDIEMVVRRLASLVLTKGKVSWLGATIRICEDVLAPN